MHRQQAQLTFYPEAFHARFQGGRLESNAAEGQQQNSEKQDLAGVRLDETAESKQTPLQLPSNPHCTSVSGSLGLHACPTEIYYRMPPNSFNILGKLTQCMCACLVNSSQTG